MTTPRPIPACLALAVLAAQPGPASARIADVLCAPRAQMVERLERSQGARLENRGIRGPDVVLEVWVRPESGAWTLVQSYANGQACIVAMGEGWQEMGPKAAPADTRGGPADPARDETL